MDALFDKHITLLHKSLDFRTQRNNLLAANVANVETPGYKAKDLVFEKALGEAMHQNEPGPLNVTNPRHLNGRTPTPLEAVKAQSIETGNPVGSADGNTVDLEREMAKLAENQVAYAAMTRMISHKFHLLKTAMQQDGGE